MERDILSACLASRDFWSKLEKFNVINDLSDIGKIIYAEISDFYRRDGDLFSVQSESLCSALGTKFNDKQFRLIDAGIRNLTPEVSIPNVLAVVRDLRRHKLGHEIIAALGTPGQGERAEGIMREFLEVSSLAEEAPDEVYCGISAQDVLGMKDTSNRIPVVPKRLNEVLEGGLFRGCNVLVFGRPDSGKTLVSINLACGFLANGYKALYIGNEDPASMMLPRFAARLSGMTIDQMRKDPDKATERMKKFGIDNLVFKELSPGSFNEIEELVNKYEPDVLVLDQLRHILVSKNLARVESLEAAAQEARNLAKKYDLVCINVTQAGDSAEGKLNLGMGDVDFSNTGIPGAMDLMIGVGVNEDLERMAMRRLSFPKNKVSGLKEPLDVSINPVLNKVMEV